MLMISLLLPSSPVAYDSSVSAANSTPVVGFAAASPPPSLPSLVKTLRERNTKILVVTGGTMSSIGKGITASSLGVLSKSLGLTVTSLKIDPYLNADAGTMSPHEHGECYVLEDGGECDLDLGNYERFLNIHLTALSSLTAGKVFGNVLSREREGSYLGKTVQVVPHVTDEIVSHILKVATEPVSVLEDFVGNPSRKTKNPDILIVELGGTVGDIESSPFVEGLRQLQSLAGYKNVAFLHVSYVPLASGEQKTKLTQHSVKTLTSLGITPDFIACRSPIPLLSATRRKVSMFTDVPESAILSIHDVSNIYAVPPLLAEQGMAEMILKRLRLKPFGRNSENNKKYAELSGRDCVKERGFWRSWCSWSEKVDAATKSVVVGVVAKYLDQADAYLSVIKALTHACISGDRRLRIEWIDAEKIEAEDEVEFEKLKRCDGVVVPGGFGSRGVEGKVRAVRHCRESKTPFLGICLGMQAAVIEYARNVADIKGAGSEEFSSDLEDGANAVIFMPEGDKSKMGGTMRLGGRITVLSKGSMARTVYGGREKISERHRHRYEVNPAIVDKLESSGLLFSGKNDDGSGERMEIVELDRDVHPYFIAAQFHPEYTSRPGNPNPLFKGLVDAIKKKQDEAGGAIDDVDGGPFNSEDDPKIVRV